MSRLVLQPHLCGIMEYGYFYYLLCGMRADGGAGQVPQLLGRGHLVNGAAVFSATSLSGARSRGRTWVLGGGGARGAAQVGALLGLMESGVEPPARMIGVSVGALNAATIAAYPSLAGVRMLRELWNSRLARDVFRIHPIGIVLSRLRGASPTALPASSISSDRVVAGIANRP